ncbi:hypothetical protein ACFE04_019730 [Oxalis oulophora]
MTKLDSLCRKRELGRQRSLTWARKRWAASGMNHSFRLGRGLCYRKGSGSGFRAIRDMSALAISDASIAISHHSWVIFLPEDLVAQSSNRRRGRQTELRAAQRITSPWHNDQVKQSALTKGAQRAHNSLMQNKKQGVFKLFTL